MLLKANLISKHSNLTIFVAFSHSFAFMLFHNLVFEAAFEQTTWLCITFPMILESELGIGTSKVSRFLVLDFKSSSVVVLGTHFKITKLLSGTRFAFFILFKC